MTLVPKDSPLKTNSESDSLISVMPIALQEPLKEVSEINNVFSASCQYGRVIKATYTPIKHTNRPNTQSQKFYPSSIYTIAAQGKTLLCAKPKFSVGSSNL